MIIAFVIEGCFPSYHTTGRQIREGNDTLQRIRVRSHLVVHNYVGKSTRNGRTRPRYFDIDYFLWLIKYIWPAMDGMG
jgi:hypothetical protein